MASREWNLASASLSTKYQHTDALGSPVAVTNEAGVVLERTNYEPYGAAINKTVDGIGYTGHVMDPATGMTYMQQRYYDPQIGRFLSVDPVTASSINGSNFNRYWYANTNPYKFIDPDGRIVINALGGAIGGIVGGIGGGVVTAIRGGSTREIVASTIGGAVGGAITGATLGAGTSVGVAVTAGIVGGIVGETTTQTVENASAHGTDVGSYEYSAGQIVVGGATGALDGVTGGLVSDVAGAALKETTKACVSEAGTLPFKVTAEIAMDKEAQKTPPPPVVDEKRK